MRQLQSTHAVIWYDRNGFMGRIANNGQTLQGSPTGGSIVDKIHRRDLVQSARSTQRIPFRQISLLTLRPLSLQLLKPIQSFNSLVIHAIATLAQLQLNHPNDVIPIFRMRLELE
jgi:hypothetical protein